jgi:hypothetical protein
LWAACVCAGCPFDTPSAKNFFIPLELRKYCFAFSGGFGMFVYFFCREINNRILEVTSIRGWFKTNCPLSVYINILSPNKFAATEAESSPVILLMILAGQLMLPHPA